VDGVKISVIIPLYNAEKYLARAVESLIQTGYPALEIIVVDDGSTDSSLQVAHTIEGQYPATVRVFQHEDRANHGISAARNLGIKKSTGELICFLDDDDFVFPHRFRTSVPILESDMTIDGVYELTRMEFEGPPDGKAFWNKDGSFGITERLESEELLRCLLKGRIWHPNAILFRRSLLDRTGLFPADRRFPEDCHLWLRMACVGRIVGGDLTDPVCVYSREENNTYHYTLERKVDIVRVMTDVYSWAKEKHLNKTTLRTLFEGVRDYVLNGIIVARESGQRDIAKKIIISALTLDTMGLMREYRLLKQVLSIYLTAA
jgi:glycosyltransferase involved in cell wall biosynthesis